MRNFKLVLFSLLPLFTFAQNPYEFNNTGAIIYTQKGALITVQGSFVNGTDTSIGLVLNDGTIEVFGDFENKGSSVFTTYYDSTSMDRAVKFSGTGTQAIKGNMNTPGVASFHNLVIDKGNNTDTLAMQTNVAVMGSVVFGTANTTSTFNPTSPFSNNNNKGLIRTYTGANEYVLSLYNGHTDAIAGYAPMAINGTPSTAYILTSGNRGSANGGLQRSVTTSGTYDFPIGTNLHGFNGIRMNFTDVPMNGGMVMGKFNDGSDNAAGYVGSISQQCFGCTANNITPDNNGYNRYFESNPCNAGAPQWVTLQNGVKDHGYWSFAADGNSSAYQYSVEVFPNTFTTQGALTDAWRTLKYNDAYGANPSAANVDWSRDIDSVSNITDIVSYTLNTGDCYTGNGIPGGRYTGFGHFATQMGMSGNALPVEMLYVKAEGKGTVIDVNWATALEINNRGFEVQRSTDAVNFTTIGWVNGQDNSTVQNDYSHTDKEVVPNTVYYYRLNQLDNDGANTLSKIVSAMVGGTAPVAAFSISDPMPNPAMNSSTIHINSPVSQSVNIKLMNMIGQVVVDKAITATAGDSSVSFDVSSLPAGSYNAVLATEGHSFAKIIVVTK